MLNNTASRLIKHLLHMDFQTGENDGLFLEKEREFYHVKKKKKKEYTQCFPIFVFWIPCVLKERKDDGVFIWVCFV